MPIVVGFFFFVLAAVLGGTLARTLKLPNLAGYIIAGIVFGALLPENLKSVSALAEIGTILLLFSIGVELSFDSLTKFLKVAVFGALTQIVLVTAISFGILNLFGLNPVVSLVLSLGFSLSSTAVVVKILSDRGEMSTIHGGVMLGWLLSQDLAVIPIMVILPILAVGGENWAPLLAFSFLKAIIAIGLVIFLGKKVIPLLIHRVAEFNSRELLLLLSIGIALGTAVATSSLGISPALGAFLAGVIISESQEHHAVFAETRPLRDLFVALFFVTLGFLVDPKVVFSKLPLILVLVAIILIVKALVVFFISIAFGYKGKTAIANSLGLAQVGEFAFVIISSGLVLGVLNQVEGSIGIAVTLFTLIVSPFLFNLVVPFWHKLKFIKFIRSGEGSLATDISMKEHIIICGYGRVGRWVGKAIGEHGIPFVVVEYNRDIVNQLKNEGTSVLYGDPTEPEVMEAAGVRSAKAVILAIPDRVAQETLIAYVQTVAPNVKIISRVHEDSDWEKLKSLRVNKIVQPEFEGAMEIIRSVLKSSGRSGEDIHASLKRLRISHAKK